jgi:1-acyl-sn-glycerol-3-phosphate acyltransferase
MILIAVHDTIGAMSAALTPAYRGVMNLATPIVKQWGRLTVSGLDAMPLDGPVLLAGNHDSWWDPIAVGMAARSRRQIQALAKASLWNSRFVGTVLDGMGQIPIDRGKGDVGALERAIADLRAGACIGVFPRGHPQPRTRAARPAAASAASPRRCPRRRSSACRVVGTTDLLRFPSARRSASTSSGPPAAAAVRRGARRVRQRLLDGDPPRGADRRGRAQGIPRAARASRPRPGRGRP